MDLSYVKKLVKLLSESDVHVIEIEEEGRKIRVAKHRSSNAAADHRASPEAVFQQPLAPQQMVPIVQPSPPVLQTPPTPAPQQYHEIKSPIVGTFYRSPAPDAAPFVEPGAIIEPGTPLCIVEAMKLMNEIESDIAGKIIKIMVENGQPVEYDQTLFLAEKA